MGNSSVLTPKGREEGKNRGILIAAKRTEQPLRAGEQARRTAGSICTNDDGFGCATIERLNIRPASHREPSIR